MRPVKEQTFAENDARLRLFYLYRLLEQYTDEEHPKTTNELRKLMEESMVTVHGDRHRRWNGSVGSDEQL